MSRVPRRLRLMPRDQVADRAAMSSLLTDVAVALNRPRELGTCLTSCATAMVAHLDAAMAAIWTVDASAESLDLAAVAGLGAAVDEPDRRVAVGRFAVGKIARDRRPYITRVVSGDATLEGHGWMRREGTAAFAGFPLVAESRVVGVMALTFGKPLVERMTTGLASVAELLALGITRRQAEEARMRDIRARQLAERTLRESEERFRLIAETVTQVFWIADVQSQAMRYISPAYETIWGRSRETLYRDPRSFLDAIHQEDRGQVVKTLEIEQTGSPFEHEYRIVRPDGETRWIRDRGFPVRTAAGHVDQYVGVAEDITDRHRDGERMRLLARALESTNEMVSVAGVDDRFNYVNRGFLHAYGYSIDEVIGQPVSLIRPAQMPEDVAAAIWRDSRQGGWSGELMNRRKDGSEFPVSLSASVIRDDHGGVIGLLGVARDVTEQRSLEEQLRQSQKMDAIGQLAGGVAHDFNNLLTAILGFAGFLLEGLPQNDERRGDVEEIRKAADRAAVLTRQLLAFSRKQILMVHVLHLGDVVGQLTPMLRRLLGEAIDLRTTIANRGLIKADPGQLQQVLVNLAVNAQDAMGEGGRLTLETADVVLDDAFARQHRSVRPGPYVMLAVSDNGHGMDAATQKRIFEPFFTTKPMGQGTGLGLATVYGIVKQSGGSIWVDSDVGRGTTFRIYLPRTEETEEATARPAADSPTARGTESVLLVEDEDLVRELAHRVLLRCGYRVQAIDDPRQAIEYASKHSETIDLVVTDVVLPAMNGRAMFTRIARAHPESKVLYMSGYADHAIVRQGVLERGMWFLPKPFTAHQLAKKVRDLLDSKAAPVSTGDRS